MSTRYGRGGALLLLLASCGEVKPKDRLMVDAAVDATSNDADTACNPTAPFGAPQEVASLNSPKNEWTVVLSADLLTAFVGSDRGGPSDIYMAMRASDDLPFGAPTPVGELNVAGAGDWAASITPDLLTMYLTSDRAGGLGGYDMYVARRASASAVFGAPERLAVVNSASDDFAPRITLDGSLYFTSTRAGSYDLFIAPPAAGGTFGTPMPVAAINSAAEELEVVLTPDLLTIYIEGQRGGPSRDLFIARRSTVADGFGAPTPVTELNTQGYERPVHITPDGCTLFFVTNGHNGTGEIDLFQATRGR